MIIVIIAITIIVIRIIEVKVIRIEILRGASLGMGSLHIKVIVSDIEGTDYNRSTICDCIRAHWVLPDVFAMEKVLHPSLVKCLSSLSIQSPQLHRKLWMEQKKAIKATTLIKALGKPTLTSAQAKRVDALGIKFEDP